jgi:hypothetical protein
VRRTARFVVAVLVIVAFPRPATAQTVVGLPGRETREVIRDSPVYITADSSLVPLTTLSEGTRVSVRRRSAEWTQIEFTDPRWGVRAAYIRTDALSPSGTVVNTPAADDTAGLTERPPLRRPAPDPHDPYIKFSVDEAIQFGKKEADVQVYWLQATERWSYPPRVAAYTTPFLRVALAASDAKKKSQPFGTADVTRDMTEAAVHIIGLDQDVKGGAIANVERIFVMPKGVKDPTRAVLPVHTEQLSEEYKHTIGFTAGERGVIAVFPLSILREGNEVHVIFDRKILDARGGASYCADCAVPIKLKGVR